MRSTLDVIAIMALAVGVIAGEAAQTASPSAAPQARGQMPTLGRPTQSGDETPPFDFDSYFLGTWTYEGVVPDSPLGSGGMISGKATFKKISESMFEAVAEAVGPDGPFAVKERIDYQKDQKTMTRQVSDSRGFAYTQHAPVGADLGGFYYIYFESEPFMAGGKSIKIKDSLRLVSPGNFRVATMISVDGGRYTNLGNPWWRKQGVDPAAK
jgi:hypothetical protein